MPTPTPTFAPATAPARARKQPHPDHRMAAAIFALGALGGIAAWFHGHQDAWPNFAGDGPRDLLSFLAYMARFAQRPKM